jgi:uncharacterized protein
MSEIIVTQLNIYPIKSTAGISLQTSVVEKTGLHADRQYMLVDSVGKFITGRQFPQLTQIQTCIDHESLVVQARGMPTLLISANQPATKTLGVNIWRDDCQAESLGAEFDEWFSAYLQTECSLVRIPAHQPRQVDPAYAAEHDVVSFADGFPILIISQASLDDLNQRLEQPVTMANFRPNIVVSGCEAYAEDEWHSFEIGNIKLKAVKPCSRCIFTTVDPETGMKNALHEPFNTLKSYRQKQGKVFFGQNLIPQNCGQICVGDYMRM